MLSLRTNQASANALRTITQAPDPIYAFPPQSLRRHRAFVRWIAASSPHRWWSPLSRTLACDEGRQDLSGRFLAMRRLQEYRSDALRRIAAERTERIQRDLVSPRHHPDADIVFENAPALDRRVDAFSMERLQTVHCSQSDTGSRVTSNARELRSVRLSNDEEESALGVCPHVDVPADSHFDRVFLDPTSPQGALPKIQNESFIPIERLGAAVTDVHPRVVEETPVVSSSWSGSQASTRHHRVE